jgi:hypothetical protein
MPERVRHTLEQSIMKALIAICAQHLSLVLVAVLAVAAVPACGGKATAVEEEKAPPASQSESTFRQIRPSDHVFTVDEVIAAGFKRSKSYDVTGLQAATAAVYGFFGPDPYNRKEYEIRFYGSHDDAVQFGVPPGKEAFGENAKLTEEDATWDADLTEIRECQGNVRGSHHVGNCLNPKYRAMVVFANLILLCQGREEAESRQTCEELLSVLK